MKKVFSNSECIHTFAQRSQSEGRNSNGSLFFDSYRLFSYGSHFCLAKFIENNDGDLAVLINNRNYSVTTSQHQSKTTYATSQYKQIFCPYPDDRTDCINYWVKEAKSILNKLQTARKSEKYLMQLSYLQTEVTQYFDFFADEIPLQLQNLFNVSDKNQYSEYLKNEAAIIRAAEQKRVLEAKKQHKKQLVKWLNFEISYINKIDYDYLRLNTDHNRIETTQSVLIPLLAAEKLYLSIKDKTLNVGDKILDYSVLNIDKKTIRIGCHTFEIKELLKFGKKTFNK